MIVPIAAGGIVTTIRLRRAAIVDLVFDVQCAQARLEDLVLVRRGLRVPPSFEVREAGDNAPEALEDEAIKALQLMRRRYWQLVAMGARREASAIAPVLPETTRMAHEVVGGSAPPGTGRPQDVS